MSGFINPRYLHPARSQSPDAPHILKPCTVPVLYHYTISYPHHCVRSVEAAMRAPKSSEAVDSSGNSGLHYAAGYGRRELVEYLLKVGFCGVSLECWTHRLYGVV